MSQAVLAGTTLDARYEAAFPKSRDLYLEHARAIFPSGVTHDLRYLEPFPIYVREARGCRKWDVDGHTLIDYWSGHGSMLLGHGHPRVVEAVRRQMERGTHPGACHELELEWGRRVQRLVPSAERVRFTASGTEATLMALRLARIHTGRPKLLKLAGHFHGWHDYVMAGSDLPFTGAPVPGVPDGVAAQTVVVAPNDVAAVEQTLTQDPGIGCMILEPTGGHFGSVPIRGAYLKQIRALTARLGRLLIFDEVITGFRVAPGGAQAHYGVTPDMTSLAKVLAGGLPGGCVAGRADIMAHLEFRPGKPKMKHPGTFNGNPLSAAAGIAALDEVATGVPCQQANAMGHLLRQRLNSMFQENKLSWIAYGDFSSFKLLPGYAGQRPTADDFVPHGGDPDKLEGTRAPGLAQRFRQALLLHGVDMPGLGGMLMAAHDEEAIDRTVAAVAGAIALLEE